MGFDVPTIELETYTQLAIWLELFFKKTYLGHIYSNPKSKLTWLVRHVMRCSRTA